MSQLPVPQTYLIDADRRYRLSVYNLGLACCAVEYATATIDPAVMEPVRIGEELEGELDEASVMVVSGTCTTAMAPAVRRLYDSLPEPRHVISFGACSNSGGPYWDSYSVIKGISSLVPVDVFVPGCPPRPETLLHAIQQLRQVTA